MEESMEDKQPLTKEDLISVLNDIIPPLSRAIGKLQEDMTEVKAELAMKPDRDEVRQIVREEVDNALAPEALRIVRVK
jgi:hypothetical protein